MGHWERREEGKQRTYSQGWAKLNDAVRKNRDNCDCLKNKKNHVTKQQLKPYQTPEKL